MAGGVTGLAAWSPRPLVGALVQAGVRRRGLRLGAEIEATSSASATRDAARGSVSMGLLTGALAACYQRGVLFGCGVVRAGWIRLAGHDVTETTSTGRGLLSAGGRVGIEVLLGRRLFVRAHVDAELVPLRYALRIDAASVYDTSALLFRAHLGLGVRFP